MAREGRGARRSLTVALLALAAGCGGTNTPAPTPTPRPDRPPEVAAEPGRLSRSKFVSRANELCEESKVAVERATRRQRRAVKRGGGRSDSRNEAVADSLRVGARALLPYYERLRALDPPRVDEARWDAFLDRIEEAAVLLPDLAKAIRSDNATEIGQLTTEFSRIARDTRPFAEEYGLTKCLPDIG